MSIRVKKMRLRINSPKNKKNSLGFVRAILQEICVNLTSKNNWKTL